MKNNNLKPVDIAIIGAGIVGLSAAIFAKKGGFAVRVFEKHFLPGGQSTAWKRKRSIFDYCIQYFYGISKKNAFYHIRENLGVIENTEFQHIDRFGRYVSADGQVPNFSANHKKLKAYLLSIAPEDSKKIKALCKAICRVRYMQIGDISISFNNIGRILKAIPAFPTVMKLSNITVMEWYDSLKNSFLCGAIPPIMGMADFPLSGLIISFALMNNNSTGYPLGGLLPIALNMEKKAKSAGVDIEYRAGIYRVIHEGSRTVGVELEDNRISESKTCNCSL